MSRSTSIGLIIPLSLVAIVGIVSSIRVSSQCEKIKAKYHALERELESLRQEEQRQNQTSKAVSARNYCESIKSTNTTNDETETSRQYSNRLESEVSDGLLVKPIGRIRSIYRLCVGTPRQGLLAPNARGSIEMAKLGDSNTASSVSGLEGYSHIWVIFIFHLNTKSKDKGTRIKSKIAPPALGGQKVGIFATRTPHRFNPIGITLCRLDNIQVEKKTQKVILRVSGLDLVDGTPVLDIKPYVPVYDSVGQNAAKLPLWVAGGLATKRTVSVSKQARNELEAILVATPNALQFYGPKHGEKTVIDTMDRVLGCIQQVLAIDVRSSFQTKKAREGRFKAERAERIKNMKASGVASVEDICTQQLDNLLIRYKVEEASDLKRSTSQGSGAEDIITVVSVELLS